MPTRVIQTEYRLGQASFLRTVDGIAAMNVNGSSSGTPTMIWDGEGSYWTPGDQGSAETYAAKTGSYGWDSSPTSLGQDTKFDHGDNFDVTAFDTLEFWMQPKAYPSGSDLQVLWRTSGGANPGNVLSVEDYVTNMDLDVWQHVVIPIEDFELGADVDKVLFKYASKGGQQFWYDDIKLNTAAGGGPYIYRVAPEDPAVAYYLTMAVVLLSAPSSEWDHDSFANIANGIDNGLLLRHRRLSTAEVLWAINSKDNADLFGRYHPQDEIVFADNVTLFGFMIKPGKASIVVTSDDVLEFVVRDNLSSIFQARAFAHYGVGDLQ